MSFWQRQRHKDNISGTFWIPVLLGVQKPDPLPSISLDTRPDPIQNSSLSWGFNEVSIFASIKILVQSQLVCLKVQLAGNILEQVCGSWWSHCYLDFGNTPSQPSSVDIKSYRGPPSPYRRYTKSSYHWDENTPKYAHDASKIWLKIILFRMKFCRCCPKTKSRKAMEQQNFFLITQLAGESIMLKRTNSAIPKCFLFIVHNHIVLIYFKTRTKGPISLQWWVPP